MRTLAIAIGLTLALLAAGTLQAGDIYKWVDEEGNVHFEDRPDGEDSERLAIVSRPSDPERIRAVTQAGAENRAKAAEAKAAAAAEQPSAEEMRREASERAQKCSTYQAKLETIMNNRRLYRTNADGEREYMDEAGMAQARETAAKRVEEFCT